MPAPGHYKVYWRNPETRVFEAIPGVHLLGDSLAITGVKTLVHWYTKAPGITPRWKKGL